MSRNQDGIDIDVFADTGDKTALSGANTDGWNNDYQVSLKPQRQQFNYITNQQNAVLVDVNSYGAALPWDVAITYEQDAVVTRSGQVYIALTSATGRDPDVGGNIGVFWAFAKLQVQETIDSTTGVAASPKAVEDYVGDRLTPYFSIKVVDDEGLTTPSQFTPLSALAEHDLVSRGSIMYFEKPTIMRENSTLFSMNIFAQTGVTLDFRAFRVDDYVGIFDNGVLQTSAINIDNPSSPSNLSFAITSGNHSIQIVHNDTGSDDQALELTGKIIQSGVFFREP